MDSAPFFADADIRLLTAPGSWSLVSALAPPDRPGSASARALAFSSRNAHRHPYRELMIVLEGRTMYGMEGRPYRADPGTVFYFSADQPHDYGYPERPPRFRHLWLGLLDDRFTSWMFTGGKSRAGITKLPVILTAAETGIRLDTALFGLEARPDLPGPLKRARCLGVVSALAAALVERVTQSRPEEDADFHGQVVHAVQDHLRRTAGRGDSLDSLARIAGYSKYHFLRLFSRHTGMTVLEFINTCRLDRVGAMRRAGASQADMARDLGFACRQSFHRWLSGRQV